MRVLCKSTKRITQLLRRRFSGRNRTRRQPFSPTTEAGLTACSLLDRISYATVSLSTYEYRPATTRCKRVGLPMWSSDQLLLNSGCSMLSGLHLCRPCLSGGELTTYARNHKDTPSLERLQRLQLCKGTGTTHTRCPRVLYGTGQTLRFLGGYTLVEMTNLPRPYLICYNYLTAPRGGSYIYSDTI